MRASVQRGLNHFGGVDVTTANANGRKNVANVDNYSSFFSFDAWHHAQQQLVGIGGHANNNSD